MLNNNVKTILNNLILEKWKPKNKKKHSQCKAKVKSRSKVWPSAYASGQVVQCYYNEETEMKFLTKLMERTMSGDELKREKKLHKKIPKEPFIDQYGEKRGEEVYYATTKKMAMENTDCGCNKKSIIAEAVKKSLSKPARKKKRGSPWFIHRESGAIIKRNAKEGRRYASKAETADVGRIASTLRVTTKPRVPGKAKTTEEIKYAIASRIAGAKHGNPVGPAGSPTIGKRRGRSGKKKSIAKKSPRESSQSQVRSALSRIDSIRSSLRK
jgi:hypothetical protein